MSDNRRLAVLIDADNTSPKVAREMFEELAGYGTLTVKRAYGDWTSQQLSGWKGELHKHAISPMQQFANTSGKNSTDSALIIDAMDLLYAGNLDGFVIVSSDADFTRLATRLRESGMTVYGIGQRKTPRAFQDACDKFTFLEVLRQDDSGGPSGSSTAAAPAAASGSREPAGDQSGEQSGEQAEDPKPNLQSMLTKALNKTAGDDDEWSALGALGSHLNRTDPSFDPRTYGFAKLSNLVREQPYLETKTVQNSSGQGQLWVRLKGGKVPPRRAQRDAQKDAQKDVPRAAEAAGKASESAPGKSPEKMVEEVVEETASAAEPKAVATSAPETTTVTKTTRRTARKQAPAGSGTAKKATKKAAKKPAEKPARAAKRPADEPEASAAPAAPADVPVDEKPPATPRTRRTTRKVASTPKRD